MIPFQQIDYYIHTTLHFIHHLQQLKNYIWKNPEHSEWDNINHLFERVEFQNCGAAHTYDVYVLDFKKY